MTKNMQNSTVSYVYEPEKWDEAAWRKTGAFTVVFLNFEKSKTIHKAVASALAQDYPFLEMFFMDDASSDGSGDVMEELVRAYRGRHKVSVVRNRTNVGITGQWNSVAKLAKGDWFGMFCADDESYPNRVSVVSNLIKKYPSLLGVCTGMDPHDIKSGKARPDLKEKPRIDIAYGNDEPYVITRKTWPCGATSFWHRSLFDTALPYVPFDDLFIKWRLHMKSFRIPQPVWLKDSTVSTVKYYVGEGLWSSIWASTNVNREIKRVAWERNIETWRAIMQEALSLDVPVSFVSVAMEGLLSNNKRLFFEEDTQAKEAFTALEKKCIVDFTDDANVDIEKFCEKLFRAFCYMSVWLKNEISDNNDRINQLKKEKRRKNRIVIGLLILIIVLLCRFIV